MYEQIPLELKKLDQWVCYNKNKIPYHPILNFPAKVNDRYTWSRFPEAKQAVEKNNYPGLGFVLQLENNIIGIDIDNCVTNNEIDSKATDIINQFEKDVYIEYSINNGIHIICKGKFNFNRNKIDNIEIYNNNRYMIMTGNRIRGDIKNIKIGQNGLDYLSKIYFNTL